MKQQGTAPLTPGAAPGAAAFAETLPEARARLVRLCARATGDPEAAEDLAQETLFEAWRAAHKLPSSASPDERGRWLSGIARNVCLRWARRRGRELSRRAFPPLAPATGAEEGQHPLQTLPEVADDFDLEVELERGELIRLLDRAMGLLPPQTRRVLYEQIVAESPLAETALRLGLSQGAVAMRLQRGKLALRRVLTTDLHQEALSLGLFVPEDVGWQQTHLWCPYCGRCRLSGRFTEGHEALWLRCFGCGTYSQRALQSRRTGFRWEDVRGYRATLSRIRGWYRQAHVPGLEARRVACAGCGRPAPLRVGPMPAAMSMPQWPPSSQPPLLLYARCEVCGSDAQETHEWLLLSLPEAARFMREHPRLRFAGTRPVEAQGHPAFVTTYESVTDGARFEVVSDAETLRILSVHGAPATSDTRGPAR